MVSAVNMNQALSAYSAINKMATQPVDLTTEAPQATGLSFGEFLKNSINQSISTVYKSEATSTRALTGKAELNDLVQAVANTELTVQTMVAIRDKVISAYQDIMRMPI
jgi:flagellar hook-basal body complex protein FliE